MRTTRQRHPPWPGTASAEDMARLATGKLRRKYNDLVLALEGRVKFPPLLRLHGEIGSPANLLTLLNVCVP